MYTEDRLTQLTERSISSLTVLENELEMIRARGHALDVEETVEGMCSVAAPVSNEDGDVSWALTMSFLEYRLATHGDDYAQAVIDAAQRLSHPGTAVHDDRR